MWLIVSFIYPFPLSEPHTPDISIRLLNICEVRSINFSDLTVQYTEVIFFSVTK